MSLAVVAQLATTLPLVGLIWTIQLVVYPQLGRVGQGEFVAYHAAHTRSITWLVAPLMLGELAAAIAWVVEPSRASVIGLGLVGIVWAVTALLSVPQHDVLGHGFEPRAHRRLVVTNWLRTAAWTARGAIVLACLR